MIVSAPHRRTSLLLLPQRMRFKQTDAAQSVLWVVDKVGVVNHLCRSFVAVRNVGGLELVCVWRELLTTCATKLFLVLDQQRIGVALGPRFKDPLSNIQQHNNSKK